MNSSKNSSLLSCLLRPSVLQRVIQSLFLLLCLHTGWQFYHFVLWATGVSNTAVSRPASVEAFLPIAALMSLRRLIGTGQWDTVHPAGLTIFLAAIVIAVVLRKGFCGYICPVGLIAGLLNRIGRRLHLSIVPRPWIARLLGAPKFILLGFFVFTICIGMDARSLEEFATAPYNYVADARMLNFFLHPTGLTLSILGVLGVLGVVLRSFWCRYLCPYGALLGLLSWFSPVHVRRDADTCIGCKKCSKACPGCITVHEKKAVLTPECLGCGRCVEACPVDGCITVRAAGKTLPVWALGVGSVVLMCGAWLLARHFGLWDQNLPEVMVRQLYQRYL